MKFINQDEESFRYEKKYGGIPIETEMDKLITKLCKADIPFDVAINNGRPQVWYPNRNDNATCDVICHWGSYGHEKGLLEMMGLVEGDDDDVEGYLTAEEVFNRIARHYYTNK